MKIAIMKHEYEELQQILNDAKDMCKRKDRIYTNSPGKTGCLDLEELYYNCMYSLMQNLTSNKINT